MMRLADGFCVLRDVEGAFLSTNDDVEIVADGGAWVLRGASDHGVAAAASCYSWATFGATASPSRIASRSACLPSPTARGQ
jgi:hypothetical protein